MCIGAAVATTDGASRLGPPLARSTHSVPALQPRASRGCGGLCCDCCDHVPSVSAAAQLLLPLGRKEGPGGSPQPSREICLPCVPRPGPSRVAVPEVTLWRTLGPISTGGAQAGNRAGTPRPAVPGHCQQLHRGSGSHTARRRARPRHTHTHMCARDHAHVSGLFAETRGSPQPFSAADASAPFVERGLLRLACLSLPPQQGCHARACPAPYCLLHIRIPVPCAGVRVGAHREWALMTRFAGCVFCPRDPIRALACPLPALRGCSVRGRVLGHGPRCCDAFLGLGSPFQQQPHGVGRPVRSPGHPGRGRASVGHALSGPCPHWWGTLRRPQQRSIQVAGARAESALPPTHGCFSGSHMPRRVAAPPRTPDLPVESSRLPLPTPPRTVSPNGPLAPCPMSPVPCPLL